MRTHTTLISAASFPAGPKRIFFHSVAAWHVRVLISLLPRLARATDAPEQIWGLAAFARQKHAWEQI
jgi:hypothetical protein